jgi:hypothetical protein
MCRGRGSRVLFWCTWTWCSGKGLRRSGSGSCVRMWVLPFMLVLHAGGGDVCQLAAEVAVLHVPVDAGKQLHPLPASTY